VTLLLRRQGSAACRHCNLPSCQGHCTPTASHAMQADDEEETRSLIHTYIPAHAEYPWAMAIASAAVLLTFVMEYTLGNIFKYHMGGSSAAPSTPSSSTTPMQVYILHCMQGTLHFCARRIGC
jgi:hypothetical protein